MAGILTPQTKRTGGILGGLTPKADVTTSSGLYDLAVQSGLKNDADRILATQTGEETKKIFSGGFISDIFDVLNTLQYGVTGVLKGKGFMKGIETRQSFSDKDALGDNGIPGVIAGIALDIAVDPLTYIAPYTIAKKIPILGKLGKAIKGLAFGKKAEKVVKVGGKVVKYTDIEGGTRIGKYLSQKFIWMSGADPIFKETWERGVKNIAVGTTNIADMTKGVSKLAPKTATKLLTKDETGRFIRAPLNALKKVLKPDEFENVSKFYNKLDDLGKEAVDLKLLSKGKWEENVGEYIKNAYLEYEQKKGGRGLFGAAKAGIKGIKARKDFWGVSYQPARFTKSIIKKFKTKNARDLFIDGLQKKKGFLKGGGKILQQFTPIPIEKLAKLGQIDNPAYLLFKSSIDLVKDVENAKLFKAINKTFSIGDMAEGFKQLPKTARLGELAGRWIPEHMAQYIQEIAEPVKYTLGKKLVADFKFFKVIMNPATHARNIVSNSILNWWKLGIGPWNIHKYVDATMDITKKSDAFKAFQKAGGGLDTMASNEIISFLDSPEIAGFGSKLGKSWGKIKKSLGGIYQNEENIAKLVAFKEMTKKGLTPENALKMAESATFNYAQVTPFVRKLRTALFGFPFITFAIKAAPVAVETALKAPHRISVFGKIKTAIENMADIETTDRERASEPPWIRDGFYIKLPMKDKHGRSSYFDLTYIIPFGDLVSGQFIERQMKRETGTKESLAEAAVSKMPALNFIKEISRNQDFYGNKIWKETDSSTKQLGDLFRHFSKTMLPPLVADQLPGGYNTKGERQWRGFVGAAKTPAEEQNQKRTLMQEMLRNVGAKIQPIDADVQETYQEWNKKKALEHLLMESGLLSQFQRAYIPKTK